MSFASVLGMGLTALGASQGERGSRMLGEGEARASEYQAAVARNNAVIAGYNADYAEKVGEVTSASQIQKSISAAGATKAAQADKGFDVTSGSAKAVQEGGAYIAGIDASLIRAATLKNVWNYKTQKTDFENQSELYGMQAANQRLAGRIRGRSSLISGYASVFNQAGRMAESFPMPGSGG